MGASVHAHREHVTEVARAMLGWLETMMHPVLRLSGHWLVRADIRERNMEHLPDSGQQPILATTKSDDSGHSNERRRRIVQWPSLA